MKKMMSIKDLARAMSDRPKGTVIFTGAGMSTDSGLSDFRSKEGLWKNIDPMEVATASAMRAEYDTFHEFYSRRFEVMGGARPNVGHEIIADLEERGLVSCVITQNIDGLHAAAGSKTIYELHGSVAAVRCMECGAPSTQRAFIDREPCAKCGGRLRPGVVLFGEGLPEDALEASWQASQDAKVFIVLGSSLKVGPANQMPIIAKRAGAALAICNRDETDQDRSADLRLPMEMGISEFLQKLDDELKKI